MRRALWALLCLLGIFGVSAGCKSLHRELEYESTAGAIPEDSVLYTPPTGKQR